MQKRLQLPQELSMLMTLLMLASIIRCSNRWRRYPLRFQTLLTSYLTRLPTLLEWTKVTNKTSNWLPRPRLLIKLPKRSSTRLYRNRWVMEQSTRSQQLLLHQRKANLLKSTSCSRATKANRCTIFKNSWNGK